MNRTEELLNNCINYLAELWKKESDEEYNYHLEDIIGLSKEEIKKYGLNR